MLKIGNVLLKRSAALAPMASVGDVVFRRLCKKFGACYIVSEMVPCKGICLNEKLLKKYVNFSDEERPIGVQLFGSEPNYFKLAVEKVLKFKPDVIDINMGCPVKKVVKTGAGCALMKNIELAQKIALIVVETSTVPVTVKIRKGWDSNGVNAVDFAKAMEACGVSAIVVHGRTRSDFYSNKADWKIIAEVKKSVKIPVIANGDVVDVKTAKMMYDVTGADLIMVGRASLKKPWIFNEIDHFLETGCELPEPILEQKMNIMLDHVSEICKFYGEEIGMKKARFHVINYFFDFKDASKLRQSCCKLKRYCDLVDLVNRFVFKKMV